MSRKRKLALFRLSQFFRLNPSILWSKNPFKIFEFYELTKDLKKNPVEKFLDLGSGFGLQTVLLRKWSGKVVGIDPYLKEEHISLHKRHKRVMFIKQKIENTNFKDEYFDKIFSFSVIEHIESYNQILRKCFSLLKSGGSLIFSCDSLEAIKDKEIIERHRKDHNVETYFRKDNLTILLEEIGFEKTTIYPIFSSLYAKELFIKAVEKDFQFGYLETLMEYKKLKRAEKKDHSQTEGIVLVIFTKKP